MRTLAAALLVLLVAPLAAQTAAPETPHHPGTEHHPPAAASLSARPLSALVPPPAVWSRAAWNGAPPAGGAPSLYVDPALLTDEPPRIPLGRVAGGTLLGGALGAGALAGAGAILGSGDDGGFVSTSGVLAVFGAALGYPVGAALGARRGATVDGRRPPLGDIMVASLAGAAAGGLVWNRIGETFEPDDEAGQPDYTSWHVGAAAGVATHLVITSLAARRAARKARRDPAP